MRAKALVTCMLAGPLVAGCVRPEAGVIRKLPEPVVHTLPRTAIMQPVPTPAARRPRPIRGATIVVDPGHGGHDPGAPGLGPVPEKVVNLAIARELVRMLEERGANVIPTRMTDEFIPLDGRAALADLTQADLLVSIHADAARRSSASGATIYVARDPLPQSVHAAQAIANAFEAAGLPCRGVSRAGYRVLVGHDRPAVLIECGYLSNPVEAQLLATSAHQARIAEAIAEGLTDHFGG
jgi:N-acetylmuramoyl-L-alanine amidase